MRELEFKRGTTLHNSRKIFVSNFSTFCNYGEIKSYITKKSLSHFNTLPICRDRFFVLKQMFVVPAIGITWYLAHTIAISGNAYGIEISNISSNHILHTNHRTVGIFSWKSWHPASFINRFTNFPLLSRNIFWHFSLSLSLSRINYS